MRFCEFTVISFTVVCRDSLLELIGLTLGSFLWVGLCCLGCWLNLLGGFLIEFVYLVRGVVSVYVGDLIAFLVLFRVPPRFEFGG